MEVRSVKANFIFSNVRLVINLLIPAAVFPYVSRVLGADGIGRIGFVSDVYDEVVGAEAIVYEMADEETERIHI